MSSTRLKTLIRILGYVLVALSLGFLGKSLVEQFSQISFADWTAGDLLAIAGATLVYAVGLALLALAWSVMLCASGEGLKHLTAGMVVYCGTAILKYLPGNVFHFVGRNLSGLEHEHGHVRLASATLFEIGLSLLTSTLLASLVFSYSIGPLPQWAARLCLVGILLCFALVLTAPSLLDRIRDRLPPRLRRVELPPHLPAAAAGTLAAYLLFAVSAAVVSVTILPATVDHQVAAATYLLAWLIGFVIPGAPGGVGVREAAIVVVLSPYCPEADALLFAFAMRLVSTVADVLLFASGRLLKAVTTPPVSQQ